MSTDHSIWTLAEDYVAGSLQEAELAALHKRLSSDNEFASSFRECVNLLKSLNQSGKHKQLRSTLQQVHNEMQAKLPKEKTNRSIPLRMHYLRTAAVAAGIALLTSFGTYWGLKHTDKKEISQYNLLRRELENMKRSQNQLIQNINQKPGNITPSSQVRYTGTGFAITNNGYFTTSYHVTEGADSVYIQSHDGRYFKASVIAFEPQTDIAILKVDDKDFRFGKGEVPYTFAKVKANLGSKVYTLGYPEDDIVYNEGYISSKNGFDNDSMQYRLELPADPGQSGAPVLDAQGDVVAIVTAKGNQSEGNTYAVGSKALLQLIHSLPREINLHVPKVNKLGRLSREKQIEKLEYYTCSVKVYKK